MLNYLTVGHKTMLLKEIYLRTQKLNLFDYVKNKLTFRKSNFKPFIGGMIFCSIVSLSGLTLTALFYSKMNGPGIFFACLFAMALVVPVLYKLRLRSKDKTKQFINCWKETIANDYYGPSYLYNVYFNKNLTQWLNKAPALVKNNLTRDVTLSMWINNERMTLSIIRENNQFYVLTSQKIEIEPLDFIKCINHSSLAFNSFERHEINQFLLNNENSSLQATISDVSESDIEQLVQEDNIASSYSFVYALIYAFQALDIPFKTEYIEMAYTHLFKVEHYYKNMQEFVDLVIKVSKDIPIEINSKEIIQSSNTEMSQGTDQLSMLQKQLLALQKTAKDEKTLHSVEHSLDLIKQLNTHQSENDSQKQYRQAKEIEFFLKEKVLSQSILSESK